jgi:hypothetical protein
LKILGGDFAFMAPTTPSAFLAEAIRYTGEDCLFWPFARDTHGRGQIRWDGKTQQVHPLICEAVHGLRPTPKHETAHSCHQGRQGCVSPRHLRWATRKENIADQPGRQRYGRKLTEDQVRDIRAAVSLFIPTYVAQRFGVSRRLVVQIRDGERWWWLQ